MAAMEVAPLPFQQRIIGFNPPTQDTSAFGADANDKTSSSAASRRLSRFFSRTKSNLSVGSPSLQASGDGFQSFQAAKTPQLLFPPTPTPMAGVHPKFGMNSGSSFRQGTASSMQATPIPEHQHAFVPTVAAQPPPMHAPAPAGQMFLVQMAPPMMMQAPICAPVQEVPQASFPTLLGRSGCPSVGSALHGTGRCQPCAWFWKAGRGCQDGVNCDHCHLCPQGELKARKKAKVAKMRAGLL